MSWIRIGKLAVQAVLLIAAVAVAPVASHGSWVVNVGDRIRLYDGPVNVNAGVFKVTNNTDVIVNNSPSDDQIRFRTFCVQTNEFLNLGEQLLVRRISNFSEFGYNPMTNSATSTQLLHSRTSALYREYLRGLTGSAFDNISGGYLIDSISDMGLLQKAIWGFQEPNVNVVGNKFTAWALALDLTNSNSNGLYGGVQILNLLRLGSTGLFTVAAQDQLYYNSGSAALLQAVPEPSMMALFMFGAIGAGWTARRRKKA